MRRIYKLKESHPLYGRKGMRLPEALYKLLPAEHKDLYEDVTIKDFKQVFTGVSLSVNTAEEHIHINEIVTTEEDFDEDEEDYFDEDLDLDYGGDDSNDAYIDENF